MIMRRLQGLYLVLFCACSLSGYGYSVQSSRVQAAYLTTDLNKLVELATEPGEDRLDAMDYIAMSDFSSLDYATLERLADKASHSDNTILNKFFNDLIAQRQILILDKMSSMTAEELTRFYTSYPQYRKLATDYISCLSDGVDSLSFHEIRYLRRQCPLFDKNLLSQFSDSRRDEVSDVLKQQLEKYCEFEERSMQWFVAALKYEVLEGLLKQFKQFAVAYSMDDNMEESLPSYIYSAYNDLLKQYWNEGIIYDYILAQTKNYNESIDNARDELMKNLGIQGKKKNVIAIPSVDMNITLGMGGFNKIGDIRRDLNETAFGAGLVSGLASFLTGGFIAGVGNSLYMSGKNEEAARAELPHRRSYLLATYDKLVSKTENEMNVLSTELKKQQKIQTQSFYDYVLQNY